MKDIISYLGSDWDEVCRMIRTYLGSDIKLLDDINENLLEHSGKRLRPMLGLVFARACNGGRCNEDSVRFAAASELLHNATLLHDDVADEADERRGVPTLRSQMGAPVSVLVGDFWLVRSVRAVLDSSNGTQEVIALLARTLADLAEGEMLQLQKAVLCDTDFNDYLSIIYMKTASLFVTTLKNAAISVGGKEEYMKAAEDYGRYLGYAFQMRDDIFDYMEDPHVGKPVGVDILEKKITLPLLCALDTVSPQQQEEIRRKVRSVTPQTRDEIIEFVRANKGLEMAQKTLDEYCNMAREALAPLPDSSEKGMLCAFASYFSVRGH